MPHHFDRPKAYARRVLLAVTGLSPLTNQFDQIRYFVDDTP